MQEERQSGPWPYVCAYSCWIHYKTVDGEEEEEVPRMRSSVPAADGRERTSDTDAHSSTDARINTLACSMCCFVCLWSMDHIMDL